MVIAQRIADAERERGVGIRTQLPLVSA
jgi:hypothetical protein